MGMQQITKHSSPGAVLRDAYSVTRVGRSSFTAGCSLVLEMRGCRHLGPSFDLNY
jgi:hypothetical protein